MKNFMLFFPKFRNDFFTKDIGIIPFIMEKYFNYKSSIITYELQDELIDNKKYLDGLEIFKIDKDSEALNDKLKNTDVLMLHGIYDFNINMIHLYKSLNPFGKVYLKLDANSYWILNLNKIMDENILTLLKLCDLITVENRRLQLLLNIAWKLDIKYLPNGYFNFSDEKIVNYKDKKNTIIFAGRVGSPEKGTNYLLEGFKNIADKIPNWNLELIGSVEDEFLIYYNKFILDNIHLKDKIKLIGKLNKEELRKKYEESKIFCLTSASEACANVLSESVSAGCYLISSDVEGAIDIIDYGKYGAIYPLLDVGRFENTLLETCLNEKLLEETCPKSQIYAKENLHWSKVSKVIDEHLK